MVRLAPDRSAPARLTENRLALAKLAPVADETERLASASCAERRSAPSSLASLRFAAWERLAPLPRSEEHTSELQSLMRISYAVFCLKTTTHYNEHRNLPPPEQLTLTPDHSIKLS